MAAEESVRASVCVRERGVCVRECECECECECERECVGMRESVLDMCVWVCV